LGFFYEHTATGYKGQGCDKDKDHKNVPVHALGYMLQVFEIFIPAVVPDRPESLNLWYAFVFIQLIKKEYD
jgi:hypothetical protein